MSTVTQQQGHLIVAAIRVLAHREERSPRPEEVAELLNLAPAVLRLRVATLQDQGIVAVVASAFDTHLEVRDHTRLDDLPAEESEEDLKADLADFDRRKQMEADRMARLFQDGEHERRQADRMQQMDDDLREFRKKKPPNPFGDD